MAMRVVNETNSLDARQETGLAESIRNGEDAETAENFKAFVGFVPGSILGGADTILQSVGLIGENTVANSLKAINETAGETFEKNKNLYRGAGDVASMFVGVGAASKLIRAGSFGIKALERSGSAGKFAAKLISTNHDRVDTMHELYRRRAALYTKEGITNSNRLRTQQFLRNSAYKSNALNNTKEAITGELTMVAFQNQSELFFPEGQSWTDVATMGTLGGGVGVGIGHIVTRGRLRKAAALAGENLPNALARFTGNASSDLVAGAFEIETVRRGPQTKLVQDDEQARGAFAQRAVVGKAAIKDAVEKMTAKSPIEGVTSNASNQLNSVKLQDAMEERAITQPHLTANIVSIEKPNSTFNFDAKRDPLVDKKKKDLAELEDEIKSKPDSGEKDTMLFKAQQAREEITLLERDTFMVDVNKVNLVSVAGEETPTLLNRDFKVNKLNPSVKNPTSDVYKSFDVETKKRSVYGIADNGVVMSGKNSVKNTSKLGLNQIAEVYSAMPKAVNAFVEKLNDPKALFGKPMKINESSTLESIDFMLSAMKKTTGDLTGVEKGFVLGDKLNTVSDLKKLALDKRFERFVKLKNEGNVSGNDLTLATNLRMADDYGVNSPAYEWFEDLFAEGGSKAMKNLKDYEQAINGYRLNFAIGSSPQTVQELISASPQRMDELLDFDLVGKLESDTPAHSLLIRSNNDHIDDLTTRTYRDVAELARQDRSEKLSRNAQNTEIPNFLGPIAKSYDDNRGLIENIRASLPKVDQAQVSEPVLREAGQLSPLTKNFRTRNAAGSKDTSAFSDNINRIARAELKEISQTVMQPVQVMRQRQNIASLQLYNNYHSAMQNGWRITDDVVPESGMFALAKEGTEGAINKEVAERMFGKGAEIPEFLPDVLQGNKAALVMDEISIAALDSMRLVDRMIHNGNQMLSQAVDRPVKNYINGHTIIPSRFGQEMVLVTDETGTVVDYALGRTLESARDAASSRVKSRKNSEKFNVVEKSDVENYKLLMDQAFNSNALDISDSFSLTAGRQAEGGRTGIIQGIDFIDAQMDEIENLVMQQANRYTAVEFMPELNQMKYMQNIANVNKTNSQGQQTFDDVYDLTGSMLLNSNNRNAGSAFARIDGVFETSMNNVLNKMADLFDKSSLGRSLNARNARNIAKEMDKKFGYHPMKRTEELLLANPQVSTKVKNDIRQITNKAGALTQQVALKFFETGHALLTTASVMTTVPHSLAMYRRIGDESDEARKARLGFAVEFLPDDSVFPNEIKLTTHTINKFMRGGFEDVIKDARAKGYLDAPMGEFMDALGSRTRGKSGEWTQRLLNASGALSQGSESFARSISFLTAYEMFNKAGKQGKQISMTMANDMANRVIADYRPHNRAELFKGVTGVPLGMFQSFAINYFEKMYEAIENKNLRELAIRNGTQAFVFGGASVAGFDFFNESVMQNWDRTQNPENYIKQGTEKGLADVLLYGTLSNLPKLLGLDDGIALNTRGEIQTPKALGIPRLSESPMFNFAGRTMGFLGDALNNVKENGGLSGDAVQESLIMASMNRPIRGWAEIAQGYATNSNHDIVKQDTREFSSIVARLVGLKTLREAEEAKALYNNRQTDLEIRDRNTRLRKSLVAKIRDNKLTGKVANDFILQYIDNGGSPNQVKRWIRNAAKRAAVSKFDDELRKKLRKDPNGRETLRLLELDF